MMVPTFSYMYVHKKKRNQSVNQPVDLRPGGSCLLLWPFLCKINSQIILFRMNR